MKIDGKIVKLNSGASVALGKGEDGQFYLECELPIPRKYLGLSREEILTNHRSAKCNLKDDNLLTELSFTPEAFYALTCLIDQLRNQIQFE